MELSENFETAKKLKNIQKRKLKLIGDYILIVIGALLTALGINIFLVPNKIASGGLSGIATVIYYLTDGRMPMGSLMLILNIPLFIVGIRYVGKKFIARTLFATVILSLIIDLTKSPSSYFINNYLDYSESFYYTPDLLLYSVFGGVIMGVGLGLVFRSGATTGGSDLAAKIINHFIPSITVGQLLLLIDSAVVVFASVVFKSVLLGLYAIITLFIMSKVIDAILEGVDFARAVYIISEKSDEIALKIMTEMDRGLTALNGRGMYTNKERPVLLCILDRSQVPQLKQMVRTIDPNAFIVLTVVREVLGEGFGERD